MNVHLAIPDLFWPDRDAPTADSPERLAALELLVARGRRKPGTASALEPWLLETWRAGAAAPHALIADGGAPGDDWWACADPRSLRVNRQTVVPLAATAFALDRAEAETLTAHLNSHFTGRHIVFHVLQPERWYAQGPEPLGRDRPPTGAVRGHALGVRPGAGGEEARQQALLNEIQMVLHDHPVNEARERAGQLPVNGLWLWGGGRYAAPAARPFARVRARDPLAAGLATGSGAVVLPLPDTAERWLRASGADGVELVLLDQLRASAAYGDLAEWRDRLAALERDWFAPLAEALRQGRIGMITLHAIGADALDVETTRQDLRYFWRRPRPLAAYVRA